jgi:hypothetical protein
MSVVINLPDNVHRLEDGVLVSGASLWHARKIGGAGIPTLTYSQSRLVMRVLH